MPLLSTRIRPSRGLATPTGVPCVAVPCANAYVGAARGRRQRDRPRRVELAAADDPLEQIAVRGEDVDESVARSRRVIVLARALLGEGDEELAADVVDPERGEARGDGRVGEA